MTESAIMSRAHALEKKNKVSVSLHTEVLHALGRSLENMYGMPHKWIII